VRIKNGLMTGGYREIVEEIEKKMNDRKLRNPVGLRAMRT
jgi:hypothetical protein